MLSLATSLALKGMEAARIPFFSFAHEQQLDTAAVPGLQKGLIV